LINAELDSVLDLLNVGVIRLGFDSNVVQANGAACRLLDLEPGRLVGRSLMETFLDHQVEECAQAATEHEPSTIEVRYANTSERQLLLRFVGDPSGDQWLLIEDVTDLRRLQRIRAEFIDNLSHELRTPVTTIRLLTETLTADLDRADVDVPPRIRERVQKIDVETGHLAQMVTELLDLSRIEGGAAELHFAEVRIGVVIGGAIERLRTFADRQRIGLETNIAPDLPAVRGDEERLEQVLVNLLHNAVKFSPAESVVTVSARRADEEGFVAVSVADHGVGIARADLDRVFERFYKADKARERGGVTTGTGLGLSIARHIVEGHGGRIWAESAKRKGSTFTFTLPVAASPPRGSARRAR
jgi:two-component system phosphate regulon sensor histidine kinase PhoR